MDSRKVKLGIAPIAWTNDDLPELGGENTFEQCVSEMALAGFTGSEVGNKYPRDTEKLRWHLEMRGISICNAWFSTFFADDMFEETIAGFKEHRDFLHAMGAKVIGCSEQSRSIQGKPLPVFAEKPVFSDEDWKRVSKGYNLLAELADKRDMRVCLHHHMGTGIQTPQEIDRYIESVNDDVYLLFDTGHIFFSEGNQQAVDELIDKHIGRIIHVHLKDVRSDVLERVRREKLSFLEAVKLGAFTVPGDGAIAFDHTFDVLKKTGYEGWMVVEAEQDPAKANPLEYALKARKFIREKTGL
ncbi:MAG: myo-inosose-2 dehydratase [Christensenellales bacterium]|jgi:inosose dehydratase